MKRLLSLLSLILLSGSFLFAIVGDWVSYGSQLTLKDLHFSGNTIKAASHGGLVQFNLDNEQFSTVGNTDHLEHIDLLRYYVNTDQSEWFSYGSGASGISYHGIDGHNDYFDFGFASVATFAGNNEHVLAVYMNDFTPEIAHFVKNNNRYIFQDIYNQFPGNPENIFDVAIVQDSIFIGTNNGLYKAYLYNSNLKPPSAWGTVPLDSSDAVIRLVAFQGELYFVSEELDVYHYHQGNAEKLLDNSGTPLTFYQDNDSLYYATLYTIYNVQTGEEKHNSTKKLNGFCLRNDTLWLAPEKQGLQRVILSDGMQTSFIPNTMLYLKAHSLALTADRKVAVCGLSGISLLDGNSWHNLVFSPTDEAIHDLHFENRFSADTLNIAYQIGGQTAVYDALISSAGELFCSLTDVSARPVSGQLPEARGPGALQRIDLDDLYEYSVYDTSDNVIYGTHELGGSSYYLKMRGLQEDEYGNIWALNVHTIDARPLIKIQPDGTIQKFSVEESGNTLQILAREMVFDCHGKLWIANQRRQSDIPRTAGGITVCDPNAGIWTLITTSDGLISNDVYSLDIDPLTGNIWAATASGVQMIYTPSSLSGSTTFNLNPPLDGLSGMIPKKIRIDPKGNKWILTESQGVQIYLTSNRWFNDGNGLNRTNSKLLDNVVYDLEFDTQKGYAYLLTASGLNRYEIAWTEERSTMNEVIIFPQPFSPGNDPYLAIDGLAEQTSVKISTIDGRVVKQFTATASENKGKQIVWDGRLDNGEFISRGVYLVFISNVDGLKATTKFAVE